MKKLITIISSVIFLTVVSARAAQSLDFYKRRSLLHSPTALLKLTDFETYGLALGVLAPRIFRLERTGIRFSRETLLKTEYTAAFWNERVRTP